MNFTLAELQAIVAGILVAGGEYQDIEIGLFVNDIEPGAATVIGDLTEPSGDWYARLERLVADEPHWTAPYIVPGPAVEVAALATASWLYTGTDPEETVYGYFLMVDSGGTPRYVGGGRLETPIEMGEAGNAVVLTPQLQFPLLAMPGWVEVA